MPGDRDGRRPAAEPDPGGSHVVAGAVSRPTPRSYSRAPRAERRRSVAGGEAVRRRNPPRKLGPRPEREHDLVVPTEQDRRRVALHAAAVDEGLERPAAGGAVVADARRAEPD